MLFKERSCWPEERRRQVAAIQGVEIFEVSLHGSAGRQLRSVVSRDEIVTNFKKRMEGSLVTSELESSWPPVWTIGHSTRSGADFIQILKANQIGTLVDVRSFPGSRRYPQFNSIELSESLAGEGITYYHLPSLGGRRRASPNSKNTALRNPSFRAYADYMETVEFKEGIEKLRGIASQSRTVFMCAEALWWRCHRSLISDYLKAVGATVIHIKSETQREEHPYTSAARIVQGRLSYEGLFSEDQGDSVAVK
jgi:hypothetical protein